MTAIFIWFISILLLIIYWLFFKCKMFLSFSIDVYVISLYWNISMNCTHFILVIYWCWHIFVQKMFQNFNIAFDYLLMLTIFHVLNVFIILNWCLCDFLVLIHINELCTLHLHWLFTDVDVSLYSILIIYWCWLFFMCKMFLSFSIYVYVNLLYSYISINGTHFILIGYLLMLINC